MFTIIKSKVSETAESPVSTGQISRVIDALGKTPTGRLSKADVINVEKTVTSILGREFTARNAAKCE